MQKEKKEKNEENEECVGRKENLELKEKDDLELEKQIREAIKRETAGL